MISRVLLVLIIAILVFAFPKIYAQQSTDPCGITKFDCYQESGFRLDRNPVICMSTPTDPNLSAKMQGYTESSVGEWSNALNVGSTSRIPKWNIQLMPIASDVCNISIEYVPAPLTDDHVGNDPNILGVTHVNILEHTALIRIFYGNADPQNDFLMTYAIRHEIGHAFGLGHYITSYDGVEPSIMIPYKSGVIYTSTISPMDITQLESLYNNNGFDEYSHMSSSAVQPSTTQQQISISTDKQVYYYGDHITTIINVSHVTGANATLTVTTGGSQTHTVTIPIAISELQTSITSPYALNETNIPTGNIEFGLSYDGLTAFTSFRIDGQLPSTVTSDSTQSHMDPLTMKLKARDWAMGELGDEDFVKVIKELSSQGVIQLPTTTQPNSHSTIPNWVKKDAKFWAQGDIMDIEFFSTLQYLIDNNILRL